MSKPANPCFTVHAGSIEETTETLLQVSIYLSDGRKVWIDLKLSSDMMHKWRTVSDCHVLAAGLVTDIVS